MATCRNQLMNEGKPYPRSGCEVCGNMFGRAGKLICKMSVKPNPPAGSTLEPEHYIDLPSEQPSEFKYAVVIKDSYVEGTGYDMNTIPFEKMEYFESEQALKDWYISNMQKTYGARVVRVIRYQELQIETELVVRIK